MKILLLSPYDALSHQYWWGRLCEGLSNHEFVVVTLPARFFSWRFRGNSLTLSQRHELSEDYDLVIATSMTDLATLKGLAPCLHDTPVILYFHENQFAYPDESNAGHQVERQITQLYSAIAADHLVFNSSFNQRTFLDGVVKFLAKMPDGIPSGVVDRLSSKSRVISVPIEVDVSPKQVPQDMPRSGQQARDSIHIVWNHRWEHDKGIDELDRLVDALILSPQGFTLSLIGQSFRKRPAKFAQLITRLEVADALGRVGFIEDRNEYLVFLQQCDAVLSTARHEFQGLAVLEAMAAGCAPIVPNALAYTEFVPENCRYDSIEQAVAMICEIKQGRPKSVNDLPARVSDAYVNSQWHNLLDSLL
jgi:glycosyltransferase involved in cell wall biosynthesis